LPKPYALDRGESTPPERRGAARGGQRAAAPRLLLDSKQKASETPVTIAPAVQGPRV